VRRLDDYTNSTSINFYAFSSAQQNIVIAYNNVVCATKPFVSMTTSLDIAIVQNIAERTIDGTEPGMTLTSDDATNVILWNNTLVSNRWNPQNAVPPNKTWINISQRNNLWEYWAPKHDTYGNDGSLIGGLENDYGVGCSGEISQRVVFEPRFGGLKYTKDIDAEFVDDQSTSGGGAGGGDYHPTITSIARNHQRNFVLKYDLDGNERDPVLEAAGAYRQ
jgi:hypothetical protein